MNTSPMNDAIWLAVTRYRKMIVYAACEASLGIFASSSAALANGIWPR